MSEQNPVIGRYMASFESSLQQYDLPEWREIASDLRNHIAEALEYGKPLDAVLEGLGAADVLARAYAIELKMNPRADSRGKVIGRVLSVLGIISASGIVSFIVVAGLGSIAVGLFGSGFGMLIIGAIEAMGIHLPGVQLAGIHPLFIVALGPVIMLVGLVAGLRNLNSVTPISANGIVAQIRSLAPSYSVGSLSPRAAVRPGLQSPLRERA